MECSFCDGNYEYYPASESLFEKKINFGPLGKKGLWISIDNPENRGAYIFVEIEDGGDNIEIPIKYCPMCGRKLKEDADG